MLLKLLALGFVFCVSCKARNNAETKSLGELVGHTDVEVCSGKSSAQFEERYEVFWSQKGIVAPEGYKLHLKTILAAVPLELQSWFFLKGGKLVLTQGSGQACERVKGTPLFLSTGVQAGCLAFMKENNQIGMPNIYIDVGSKTYEEQVKELSLVVQGFAALFTSFMTEVSGGQAVDDKNNLVYTPGGGDVEARTIKIKLSFKVIEDLLKMKSENGGSLADGVLQRFDDLESIKSILDEKVDRAKRWDTFFQAHWKSTEQKSFVAVNDLTNYLSAQVFEAKWCNDETRQYLKDGAFARTGVTYEEEAAPIVSEYLENSQQQVSLTEGAEATVPATPAGVTVSTPDLDSTGLGLGQRVLPVLGGLIRAPFAVSNYFVNNQPVRTFFRTHQPVRTVILAVGQAAKVVGIAAAQTVVQAGRVVIQGAAEVLTGGSYVSNGMYGSEFTYINQPSHTNRSVVYHTRIGYRVREGIRNLPVIRRFARR